MKRLTFRYRNWLLRRARNEHWRCRKRTPRYAIASTQGGAYLVRLGRDVETPPSIFCFDRNLEETLQFLAAIRLRSRLLMRGVMMRGTGKHRGRLTYLNRYYDFAQIREITPSAALVLAAEYDRNLQLTGHGPMAINLPTWAPAVRGMLQELGFFDLLEISENAPTDTSERMILRFRSGSKVEPTQIGGPQSMIGDLFGFIGQNKEMETQLYSAVIEAMNNVVDHAIRR